ncbi:MAG TPA: acyl-CoA desaturase [Planctomycetaceae bacterium]|nr:acyl-CoA desaturase [Planctomycetaceae bacterium]
MSDFITEAPYSELKKNDGAFHTIPHRIVSRTLAVYVTLCHVIPFLGAVSAVVLIPSSPPSMTTVLVTIVMWFLSLCIGITVGYHRLFSHRAFQTTTPIRVLIGICGAMAGQGPLIAWVALHRSHHKFSDEAGDPHSPWPHGLTWIGTLQGLWHAHFGWVLSYDMPDPLYYCPDLIKDRAISRTSRLFLVWYLLGLLLPAAVVGLLSASWWGVLEGFLWAGCFRVAISSQVTWCINSICHVFGPSPYKTGDHSTNLAWLAVPSFGESWHNNHHAYPRSAMFGHRWWQIDFGYTFISVLQRCGLAWDVQLPKHQPQDR